MNIIETIWIGTLVAIGILVAINFMNSSTGLRKECVETREICQEEYSWYQGYPPIWHHSYNNVDCSEKHDRIVQKCIRWKGE